MTDESKLEWCPKCKKKTLEQRPTGGRCVGGGTCTYVYKTPKMPWDEPSKGS
jgi:hypothetical protein